MSSYAPSLIAQLLFFSCFGMWLSASESFVKIKIHVKYFKIQDQIKSRHCKNAFLKLIQQTSSTVSCSMLHAVDHEIDCQKIRVQWIKDVIHHPRSGRKLCQFWTPKTIYLRKLGQTIISFPENASSNFHFVHLTADASFPSSDFRIVSSRCVSKQKDLKSQWRLLQKCWKDSPAPWPIV